MYGLILTKDGATFISTLLSTMTTILSSVTSFLTSIYAWAVSEELILFIIGLGFVGVMFRWGRSLVNFIKG